MTTPPAAHHPLVKGRCPACRGTSLFLGSGGYVTCSRLDCPDPCAADHLLHGEQPVPVESATALVALPKQQPREHCGDLMPVWVAGPRSECILLPGHPGSHADDHGARWWYDPNGTGQPRSHDSGRYLRTEITALRDDLNGITGARWIADSLTTILDKEPPMPATGKPTCTARIEGPHIPDTKPITCTLEAGHPGHHAGPNRDYGNLRWTDHHAGATPHTEQP